MLEFLYFFNYILKEIINHHLIKISILKKYFHSKKKLDKYFFNK